MKDFDRISFSKDVAETLGVEAAIILELYQQNKITYSGDSELFKTLVKQELPFIEHALIEACLKKTIKLQADIKFTRNNKQKKLQFKSCSSK